MGADPALVMARPLMGARRPWAFLVVLLWAIVTPTALADNETNPQYFLYTVCDTYHRSGSNH
jgi:hypothetical protein